MFHINLLPEDIKKDVEKRLLSTKTGIPLEVIVGSIGGVFVVLILFHAILTTLYIQRLAAYRTLEQEWKTLETRRNVIDSITRQLNELKAEETALGKVLTESFYFWAPTFNHMATNLPKGVWLSRMNLESDEFTLHGSAVARDMDEIVEVHSYVNKLRADAFLKIRFKDFALDSVSKRKVQKVDVADFVIKSKINSIGEETKISEQVAATVQASSGERMVFDSLPGIPESAKANTKVMDKKPATSLTR